MLDVPSISAIVAAVGVIIGVVFTVLELRNLVKQRKTDLIIGLYSRFSSNEFQDSMEKIMSREFDSFDEYTKKYGWSKVVEVALFFEGLGILLHERLIDIELLDRLFSEPIKMAWKKMKPMIEADRKQHEQPRIFEWFEYLCNEMKKRQQSGI